MNHAPEWGRRRPRVGNSDGHPRGRSVAAYGEDGMAVVTIGRIRSAARGFHDPESFITMIMLDRAGIAPKLPWAL